MKRKLFTIFLSLSIIATSTYYFWQNGFEFNSFVSASGGFLDIEFGGNDLDGAAVFLVSNMLPGDCEEREITIKNESSSPLEVFLKSSNEIDSQNLATQMDWYVDVNGGNILTTLLSDYYADSNGVSLGNFSANETKTIHLKACFHHESGNEFQNTKTQFDLVFYTEKGHNSEIPEECGKIKNKLKRFILGNSGNNNLHGSAKSDFIFGAGGNDDIDGSSAVDCLVGGEGNDKIDGSSGADILVGQGGNDEIEGGSGNDEIYGGEGNDKIKAESGADYVDAQGGLDNVHGGTGTDKCLNSEIKTSCELPI